MSVNHADGCRRLHRVIGAYFSQIAWCKGADCVALDRKIVELVLDVERIKTARVELMRQQIRTWFPYFHAMNIAGKDSVGSVYLSRVPIAKYMSGKMSAAKRVKQMAADGVVAIRFSDPEQLEFSELGMVTQMTALVNGLKAPAARRVKTVR